MMEHLRIIENLISKTGDCEKYLWEAKGGHYIESVFIQNLDYDSVCVSSQVGCSLKCAFCATGLMGLKRNLDDLEIVAQVEGIFKNRGTIGRNTKISFMGMGEPLLNLNNVDKAQRNLKEKYQSLRFSLSTIGIPSKLIELANKNLEFQLQISLHAPNDALRSELIPVNKRFPIKEIIKTGLHYSSQAKNTLRLNYLLFPGVNDSDAHIIELNKLLKGMPVFLKISKYNTTSTYILEEKKANNLLQEFEAKCIETGLDVYTFESKGVDIEGGCGQLVGSSHTTVHGRK